MLLITRSKTQRQRCWPPLSVALVLCLASMGRGAEPTGDGKIHGPAGKSEIVITTTARLAGAIHSLTWDGREFIDSADHGRQLQSASNLGQPFFPETFNPTEAGSRADGAGPRSSSRLLAYSADGSVLETTIQMAFWLKPGERSDGHPAANSVVLSQHLLTKRVQIGYKTWPHLLDYRVTFTVPEGETHTYAQFEALTGYMPPDFSRFEVLTPEGGLKSIDDGPGEQWLPVVFSTREGGHAMGIYSPDQPSPGFEGAGYGRFRFKNEKVVKWNCVFRVRDAGRIKPGKYAYQMFVAVGTRDDVQTSLQGVMGEFRSAKAGAAAGASR